MTAQHPSWSPETERAFKEVLYRFMGDVHATKAALYLSAGEAAWELATHYGFGRRDQLAPSFADDHPIVRMVRAFGADPRYYNDPTELGEVEEYLAGAGTSRMMLVPLIGRFGLAGFVDVRDKGGQRAFAPGDLDLARSIAFALTQQVEIAETTAPEIADDEPAAPPAKPAPAAAAHTATGDGGDAPAMLDEIAIDDVNGAASDALADPRVTAVAVTLADGGAGSTLIHQPGGAPDVEVESIIRHQSDAIGRATMATPPRSAWKTEVRRSRGPGAASNSRQPMIATSILLDGPESVLVGSVVVDAEPAVAREALERLGERAQAARDRFRLRIARRGLARRLLQPGDRRYPELVAHSLGVSRLCWSIARVLEFDEAMVERAALAGLLHDVGMRELDYDRLYMHPTPGPEDRRTYRLHVEVGDRIVRVEGFEDIADAVRHHHERWDGNGYPDRLAQNSIPVLARIVHVAEVFDLFTEANSYRPAVSHSRALAILENAAGHQFDPKVVEAIAKVVA